MIDDGETGEYAFPPCFMHKLDPTYRSDAWRDVARWRKAQRERLIQERLALSSQGRETRSTRLAKELDKQLGSPSWHIIPIYWPFRGEPDLRGCAARMIDPGN